MKIRLVGDIAGMTLLMALFSCGTQQQGVSTQSGSVSQQGTEEVVKPAQTLVRRADIPMVQVDALSTGR